MRSQPLATCCAPVAPSDGQVSAGAAPPLSPDYHRLRRTFSSPICPRRRRYFLLPFSPAEEHARRECQVATHAPSPKITAPRMKPARPPCCVDRRRPAHVRFEGPWPGSPCTHPTAPIQGLFYELICSSVASWLVCGPRDGKNCVYGHTQELKRPGSWVREPQRRAQTQLQGSSGLSTPETDPPDTNHAFVHILCMKRKPCYILCGISGLFLCDLAYVFTGIDVMHLPTCPARRSCWKDSDGNDLQQGSKHHRAGQMAALLPHCSDLHRSMTSGCASAKLQLQASVQPCVWAPRGAQHFSVC
ncbi:hypothetical protein E2562_021829 [Oryza meyeriana var. granulata]|uniref:Uncharacterized protein n=1 Tax=Oryza meyeriana var. granulata TaxID=110450 RepID=A0A6G1END8_9ORYZ|nr:hypothetical protein E2562_021829 [Oryza meyeriana var. granulata]